MPLLNRGIYYYNPSTQQALPPATLLSEDELSEGTEPVNPYDTGSPLLLKWL